MLVGLVYALHIGFKMGALHELTGNLLPDNYIKLVQRLLESIGWVALMVVWRFPRSWLIAYVLMANLLAWFHIISPAKLGLVVLFLGIYLFHLKKHQAASQHR